SAEISSMPASLRSRAINSRMSSNSFFDVVCLCAFLLANKLGQVTFVSFHKYLRTLQDAKQEMVRLSDLVCELRRSIVHHIDISAQSRLAFPQRRRQIR